MNDDKEDPKDFFGYPADVYIVDEADIYNKNFSSRLDMSDYKFKIWISGPKHPKEDKCQE